MKVELEVHLVFVLLDGSNAQLRTLRSGWHRSAIVFAVETVIGIVGGRIAVSQVKIAVQERSRPIVLDALTDGIEACIESIVVNVLHWVRHENHRIASRALGSRLRNNNWLRKVGIVGSKQTRVL